MTNILQNYRRVALFSILAIVPLLLISNSVISYGQTNTTNATNQTSTSGGPNSELIKLIDSGILMIKSGDNEGAKKSLLSANPSMAEHRWQWR